MSSALEYAPLDENNIRLVQLLPTDDDEVLRCSLSTFSLAAFSNEYLEWMRRNEGLESASEKLQQWRQHVSGAHGSGQPQANSDVDLTNSRLSRFKWGDYATISYHWGSVGSLKEVIVEGHPISVTENLYLALVSASNVLRSSSASEKLFLWVDALCINQEDLDERSREILKMRRIFSSSCSTLVSLGSEWPGSGALFDILRELPIDFTEAVESLVQWPRQQEIANRLLDLDSAPVRLRQNPYWSRGWIIQELAAGADPVVVMCGDSTARIGQCQAILWFLGCTEVEALRKRVLEASGSDYISASGSANSTLQRRDFLQTIARMVELGQHVPIIDLCVAVVALGFFASTTVPSDRLFSLLGLLPKSIVDSILVDYTADAHKIFVSFAKAMTQVPDGMDYICVKNQKQRSKPSWAPDLRVNLDRAHTFHLWNLDWARYPGADSRIVMPIRKEMFETAKLRRADGGESAPVRFSDDDAYLHCRGFCLGSIAGIYKEVIEFGDGHCSEDHEFSSFPERIANPYGTDENAFAAFTATLYMLDQSSVSSIIYLMRHLPRYQNDGDEDYLDLHARLLAHTGWQKFSSESLLRLLEALYVYADFPIAGKPLSEHLPPINSPLSDELAHATEPDNDLMQLCHASAGARRLAILDSGHFALVPAITKLEDQIFVLLGAAATMALRPAPEQDHDKLCYEVLNEAYVVGYMNGEGLIGVASGDFSMQDVVLC